MKYHDIKKITFTRIKIKDKTKNKQGLPTFLNMERRLKKELTIN